MTIRRLLGWAALAAVLGGTIPAPASAQIGGFLKRKLAEKVAAKVVARQDTAAIAQDTAAPSAPARTGTPARARKPMPGASGPVFNEYNLEITSDVLDRLEKLLAAQEAARADVARRTSRFLPKKAYDDCVSKMLMKSPESPALMAELRAAAQKTSPDERQKAMEAYSVHLEKVKLAACGPDPIHARDLRTAMQDSANKAALEHARFTPLQYATVLERLVPFCDAAASGDIKAPGAVYSPVEVTAMKARCVSLAPALKRAASPWT